MEKPIAEASCINPNEYEPWELEAYADGEEMPQIRSHLERCRSCQIQLQRNTYLDSGLTASFYRFDCPSLDVLYDYHHSDVSDQKRAHIESHLQFCPPCAKECQRFLELEQVGNLDVIHNEPSSLINKLTETVEGVTQNFGIAIATLISPQESVAAVPLFRGDQRGKQLLFTADEAMVSLSLNAATSKTFEISGQVLNTNIDDTNARFRFVSEDREISGAINTAGVFNIKDVQKGFYQLSLYMVSQTIIIPNLQI